MKRLYAVIELADDSLFDPTTDADLDALAEDLLSVTHKVVAATVYASAHDLMLDEDAAAP